MLQTDMHYRVEKQLMDSYVDYPWEHHSKHSSYIDASTEYKNHKQDHDEPHYNYRVVKVVEFTELVDID